MHKEKIKLLEAIVVAYMTTAYKDKPINEEIIRDIVSQQKSAVQANEEECKQVIKNIHARYKVILDEGILIKSDEPFYEWYDERKANVDFNYWERYKTYLSNAKMWNSNIVNTIDKVSDDVVSLLGDPNSDKPWKRRGLVIGDVQSGKTANFTAICNKAVDVGYKVIIILTGTIESLRKQTQERQDSDLVGFDSFMLLNDNGKSNKHIGVGMIDPNIRLMTFTSTKRDFRTEIVTNIGLSLKNCNDTALFVVKKNKSVLENLETWLKKYNANNSGQINSSVLIIDDESDNASVNTKVDEKPTAINKCIRNLLHCFTKESYLAVTATPYANIFINPEIMEQVEEEYGQDLFPRDFIYCLASPSNYIGAKDIFLDDSKYESCLNVIKDAEDIIPIKHKSDYILYDIPDSLKEAICHFILVNAIRDYRKEEKTHRSMLINVSRFTNVQNQYGKYIEAWLEQIKGNVKNFAKLSHIESIENKYIKRLYELWQKFKFEETVGCTWEEIRVKYLTTSLFKIKVKVVNQSSPTKGIDYSLYEHEGYRVIAIGGNSLSRGLTLEGLCTTYFYRNSQSYDTLMQMGRWFGYRTGYEDLFKIWMTSSAIKWYQTICLATEELKREIKMMNNEHLTPKEFGLRVKEDPASLIVTARNKMKNTEIVEWDVDVNGKVVETISIDSDNDIINKNYHVIKDNISKLTEYNISTKGKGKKSYYIENVDKEHIINILDEFIASDQNLNYNRKSIIEFINDTDHLEKWDIVIPSGKSGKNISDIIIGENELKIEKETRQLEYLKDQKCITVYGRKNSRIITGDSLKIGLSKDAIDRIVEEEKANSNRIPNNAYLYQGRNPLLFIHFIDGSDLIGVNKQFDFEQGTFTALSLAFPTVKGIDKKKKVRYRLNMVAIKQNFIFDEDEEW